MAVGWIRLRGAGILVRVTRFYRTGITQRSTVTLDHARLARTGPASAPEPLQVSCMTCRFAGPTGVTVERSQSLLDSQSHRLARGVPRCAGCGITPSLLACARRWYITTTVACT